MVKNRKPTPKHELTIVESGSGGHEGRISAAVVVPLADLVAHDDEGLVVFRQGLVELLVQVSQAAETIPHELQGLRISLHPKGGNQTVEFCLFASGPATGSTVTRSY